MKSFKFYIEEEAIGAANSVGAGGVSMPADARHPRDKRRKGDVERMYRRATGLDVINRIMKKNAK